MEQNEDAAFPKNHAVFRAIYMRCPIIIPTNPNTDYTTTPSSTLAGSMETQLKVKKGMGTRSWYRGEVSKRLTLPQLL